MENTKHYCRDGKRFFKAPNTMGEKLLIIEAIAASVKPDRARYIQARMPPAPNKSVKTCPITGITKFDREILFFVATSAALWFSAIFIMRSGNEGSAIPYLSNVCGSGIGPTIISPWSCGWIVLLAFISSRLSRLLVNPLGIVSLIQGITQGISRLAERIRNSLPCVFMGRIFRIRDRLRVKLPYSGHTFYKVIHKVIIGKKSAYFKSYFLPGSGLALAGRPTGLVDLIISITFASYIAVGPAYSLALILFFCNRFFAVSGVMLSRKAISLMVNPSITFISVKITYLLNICKYFANFPNIGTNITKKQRNFRKISHFWEKTLDKISRKWDNIYIRQSKKALNACTGGVLK